MNWKTIEAGLANLQPVEGGFTNAERGIVTTGEGQNVFVKIGTNDITKNWARKEIGVYKTLQAIGYPHIPELVAVNDDETGFALTSLQAADGWEWETPWTEDRLAATLDAMDALAALSIEQFDTESLAAYHEDTQKNQWDMPEPDTQLLIQKLEQLGRTELIARLPDLRQNFSLPLESPTLVHYDVRRDNAAWNASQKAIKLVDWNWLHAGSRKIDVNALLVNVYRAGLDLRPRFGERLDHPALLWLAGMWLAACVQPGAASMSNADALRQYQFESGLAAYDLAELL